MFNLSISSLVLLCVVTFTLHCANSFPADQMLLYPQSYFGKIESPVYTDNQLQEEMFPIYEEEGIRKNCFHFFATRKMSTLLTEATKMLKEIRDKREREWLLTFIYRIKSLAEHLRSHPESRNYDCLPYSEEMRKQTSSVDLSKPELYFIDDISSSPNKRSQVTKDFPQQDNNAQTVPFDNQTSYRASEVHSNFSESTDSQTHNQNAQKLEPHLSLQTKEMDLLSAEEKESNPNIQPFTSPESTKIESGNVLTSMNSFELNPSPLAPYVSEKEMTLPNSKAALTGGNLNEQSSKAAMLESENDPLVAQLHSVLPSKKKSHSDDSNSISQEKKLLVNEMVSQVKKFRHLGGSWNDFLDIWRLSQLENETSNHSSNSNDYFDVDFDYAEVGAAAGDLETEDTFTNKDRTVAPSLGEVINSKETSFEYPMANFFHKNNYNDDLVNELEEEGRNHGPMVPDDLNLPSETTKPLSGQNGGYSSTQSILIID